MRGPKRAASANGAISAFAGGPFLLRDLLQDYAGGASSYGNRALARANDAPSAHAESTRRFMASGVNIFGKPDTPDFGIKANTEPAAFNGPKTTASTCRSRSRPVSPAYRRCRFRCT